MDEARDAGLTMADRIQLALNGIASTAIEVLGPAGPLLTAVASLASLGGPLARGLVSASRSAFARLGGDAALRAAIGAAGTAAGLIYQGAAFAAGEARRGGTGRLVDARRVAGPGLGQEPRRARGRHVRDGVQGGGGRGCRAPLGRGLAAVPGLPGEGRGRRRRTSRRRSTPPTGQSGSEAIANLRNLTTTMRELQGADRILADTFGGAQQVEGLRNLAVAAQLRERFAVGVSTEEGLVFVTPRGLPVSHPWLTQHFQDLLAAAGLPKMRLHDLRHGAATLLLGAGVHPRVAQQLLRHASSKTTTEIYSHVTAAQERQAAEVLQAALVGARLVCC